MGSLPIVSKYIDRSLGGWPLLVHPWLLHWLYMMQPEGFVDPKGANKVCKLQRSIYGLVQTSRSWNIRFDELIKAYSFIQTCGEACIYKKVSGSTTAFLISIYELLIGNDIEFSGKHNGVFERSFSKKDLGEAAYTLSMKIYRK